MAASPALAAHSPQSRLKYVLLSALALMFLFVLWHNERFIVDHSHPDWKYYFPVRWLLLPHGLAGLTALLIGPFQLSSRFRKRHLRVHRIMGRFYLGGIAVAAPMGMYIALIHSTVALRFFVFALAIPWLLTGATAFICVGNGNIPLHRQWMVRSYALTSIFVTGRIVLAIPAIERAGEAISVPVLWSVLVVTLVLTELGLAWRGIFTNNRRATATARES
jgi:Predicted membrane protein (DUF2306)